MRERRFRMSVFAAHTGRGWCARASASRRTLRPCGGCDQLVRATATRADDSLSLRPSLSLSPRPRPSPSPSRSLSPSLSLSPSPETLLVVRPPACRPSPPDLIRPQCPSPTQEASKRQGVRWRAAVLPGWVVVCCCPHAARTRAADAARHAAARARSSVVCAASTAPPAAGAPRTARPSPVDRHAARRPRAAAAPAAVRGGACNRVCGGACNRVCGGACNSVCGGACNRA